MRWKNRNAKNVVQDKFTLRKKRLFVADVVIVNIEKSKNKKRKRNHKLTSKVEISLKYKKVVVLG